MASPLKESSTEQAGSNPLKTFLVKHQHALKITNANKLDALYDTLTRGGIGRDDLFSFEREILKASLVECGLKSLEIGRIIGVLLKAPESYVRRQPQTQFITISNEEEETLTKLQQAPERVQANLDAVLAIMDRVDAKSKEHANSINQTCDAIIENLNRQRADLLRGLQVLTQQKQQSLSTQQSGLERLRQRLTDFYAKSQQMLGDSKADETLRKKTIEATSKSLLSAADAFSATELDIELKVNGTIVGRDTLSDGVKIQMVTDEAPLAPIVEVVDIKAHSATLNIETTNGAYRVAATECKVQNGECGVDDTLTRWNSAEKSYGGEIKVPLTSLTSFTEYKVRVALKNKHGWGPASTSRFETDKHFVVHHEKLPALVEGYLHTHIYEEHPNEYIFDVVISDIVREYVGRTTSTFDVIADKWRDMLLEAGTVFCKPQGYTEGAYIYAACSEGYSSGSHEWRVQTLEDRSGSACAVGIISDLTQIRAGSMSDWVSRAAGSYYSYYYHTDGRTFSNNRAPTSTENGTIGVLKANDVLAIKLDCAASTVTFIANDQDHGTVRTVAPEKTYFLFVMALTSTAKVSFRLVA